MDASALRTCFESPLPSTLFAAGGIMSEQQTGIAVLVFLAGGSFLLQVWLGLKKAGQYNKADRMAEQQGVKAEMASRSDLQQAKDELRLSMNEFRRELKEGLEELTHDFNETIRDLNNALGRLQGMHERAEKSAKGGAH